MKIYKISYVKWHGDKLFIGGKENQVKAQVMGNNHKDAVAKLRRTMRSLDTEVEVTGIEDMGELDIA